MIGIAACCASVRVRVLSVGFLWHGLACSLGHIANDRLPAFTYRDVLHRNFLLATGPVALECLHLCGEGPHQFVESALGAILMW